MARGRPSRASEYGRQLKEKQELKKIYGLREGQFERYVRMSQALTGNSAENLLTLLESRLDNVIFRAGFALSRLQSRQYASHGLFKLNGRRVDIPSIFLKPDDLIEPRKKEQFSEVKLASNSKWLETDDAAKTIRIKYLPKREDIDTPIDENLVMQFYSR